MWLQSTSEFSNVYSTSPSQFMLFCNSSDLRAGRPRKRGQRSSFSTCHHLSLEEDCVAIFQRLFESYHFLEFIVGETPSIWPPDRWPLSSYRRAYWRPFVSSASDYRSVLNNTSRWTALMGSHQNSEILQCIFQVSVLVFIFDIWKQIPVLF